MSVQPVAARAVDARSTLPAAPKPPDASAQDDALRESFQTFVGEALFGQMLKSMRKTVGKPAYFHGGRAEEIFQRQLDQVLAQKITCASADKLAGPMFELFSLSRK